MATGTTATETIKHMVLIKNRFYVVCGELIAGIIHIDIYRKLPERLYLENGSSICERHIVKLTLTKDNVRLFLRGLLSLQANQSKQNQRL